MTVDEVLADLQAFGNEQTKKVLARHGAREPFFGVKVEDLKKIQKKIRLDHELAMRLYSSGNSDAMYLASLICDPARFSPEELNDWVEKAYWYYLSEYAVASVASRSPTGFNSALIWIRSDRENIASAGWATLSSIISKNPDSIPDIKIIKNLLDSIPGTIHNSPNRVRYAMNNFIIAAGGNIGYLNDLARSVAHKVGKVSVDMGGTACKVPDALGYIEKVLKRKGIKS